MARPVQNPNLAHCPVLGKGGGENLSVVTVNQAFGEKMNDRRLGWTNGRRCLPSRLPHDRAHLCNRVIDGMGHAGTTPATANEPSRASCQIQEWRYAKQVAQTACARGRDVYRSYRMAISGLDCFRACLVNLTILSSWRSTLGPNGRPMHGEVVKSVSQASPTERTIQTLASSEPMTRKVSSSCIGFDILAFSSSAQHRLVHQWSRWDTQRLKRSSHMHTHLPKQSRTAEELTADGPYTFVLANPF
jgi:hypothetical protein